MCGIGGFLGQFDPAVLEDINRIQRHRGPDDSGTFWDRECSVGLCHQRLSIIDLSKAGHQPMLDSEQRYVISYNGEIYNYRELRESLGSGVSFRGASDTEVLLNLYRRDEKESLSQLNGIFAFAIWDRKEKELVLARDPLGVKPLYYTQTQAGFAFASELKSLIRLPGVDRGINHRALASYLSYIYSPSPDCMVTGVKKLLPGHYMVVRQDGSWQSRPYYQLPIGSEDPSLGYEEVLERLEVELAASVKRQMTADVPVGAFLSGGLDSSTVVAHANRVNAADRLKCFTMTWEGDDCDGLALDLPYANKVAEHLKVDLDMVSINSDMVSKLPEMIYQLDEPQADPAALNTLFISELARRNGIKVLLSGAGGDDLFTGYRRHRALDLERYWGWFPKFLRHRLKGISGLFNGAGPTARRIKKAFQYAHLDAEDRIASYFLWLDPELARSVILGTPEAFDPMLPLKDQLGRQKAGVSSMNRMLELDLRYFLTDHNLNYTDKMSMAAGVEVRVPLIDLKLVDLAFQIPVRFKQNGRHGKWILKKAAESFLPHDVIYRPKTGFGVPLRQWFGHESEIVCDFLSPSVLRKRGLFDEKAVRHLMALDAAGKVDAAYPLFAIVCMEMWCREFLDNPK